MLKLLKHYDKVKKIQFFDIPTKRVDAKSPLAGVNVSQNHLFCIDFC